MHRYRQEEADRSSTWKRLELEGRSTSFPAAVNVQNSLLISQTCEDPNGRRKHEPEDDSIKSWAKSFQSLAQSSLALSSPSRNNAGGSKRKTIDAESLPRSPLRIPVLTMTLIKLHDVFETFCHHLIDATFIKARAACLVLDSAETVSSSKLSEPNSPATIIGSPGSHKSTSSPSRSPIASWFIGSYNSETDFSQKSEWEKACNPLIIFSGLEAIYYACSHVESHVKALVLVRLYRRTIDDLLLIRKALCDPFVYSTRNEQSPGPNSISTYREKAVTLSLSIEAIMSLCECRCKLIEQQIMLFSSNNMDTEKLTNAFQAVLHSLPKAGAKSTPIVKSVLREVEAWCSIMKTYSSFEKYRFMHTIVGCQEIKLKLNSPSDTRIQKWMSMIYQSFVSMLPIYFESVSSDVLSRYGYQESSFRKKPGENRYGPNPNLEPKLEEFLRFEERSGTPFALAVVANVDRFHMHRSIFNHGSLFGGKEKASNISRSVLESGDILSEFPAVFIRTTTDQHLSSNLLGARRNSGKKEEYDYTLEKNGSNNISLRRQKNSWPFTSWSNIVPMLKNTMLLSPDDDPLGMNWSQVDSDTSIYASPLDDVMWLVAMKKINDDSRWNRRHDEERSTKERQFFSDISTSLRLRDVFKSNLKMNSDDTYRILNELTNTLVANTRLLDNDNTSQLLELFKKIFGLRSQNNKHSIRFRKQNATVSPKSLEGLQTWSSPLPSHFAFFLGGNLMNISQVGDK